MGELRFCYIFIDEEKRKKIMKKFLTKTSDFFQLLGRSMLLAIAVMPAAAILNRLSDGDMFDIPFLKAAAWTIFAILPVLFAISVSGGISDDKNVAAGLAAVVVYEILVATLQAGGDTDLNSFGLVAVQNIRSNVLLGIVSGIIAGYTYNYFKDKQLPSALAFFGGRRLVIIMSSFFAIIASVVFAYIFPAIENGFTQFGMMIGDLAAGPAIFSFLNRLLIPTGLHHIVGTYIQMQLPSTLPEFSHVFGEVPRYFAGDPTAGRFMSGFFSMMMFGLPGAALAIHNTAKPENKATVRGLMISAAAASFVTGITEPIEFSFMFVSPILFFIHAIFMGLTTVLANLFGIRIVGVGGAGIIDYILQYNKATNPLMVIVVGLIMFGIYYFTFSFLIKKLDLKTPGREDTERVVDGEKVKISMDGKAATVLELIGGKENLKTLDNCITRLRIEVEDFDKIDIQALKDIGIIEVMKLSNGKVHIVVGLEVEQLANEIQKIIQQQEALA